LAWFAAADYPEVFLELEANGDAWAERFAGSDAGRQNVEQPLAAHHTELAALPADAGAAPRTQPSGAGRQVRTLTRRTADVLVSNKGQFRLLALQAPIIAVLLLVVGFGNLATDGAGHRPRIVLAVLMLGAVTMGLVNSCREIVRELPVYRRERTVGLSLGAYLTSKFVVLGALGLLQSVVLVAIVVSAQDGPEKSVVFGPPILELGLIVFLTALASVALGLAVSAWVATDAAALVLIPVLLIAQLVLSDSIIAIEDKPGLAQLAWVAPSYWGFRGQAASTHMVDIELVCLLRSRVESAGSASQQELFASLFGEAPCRSTWRPTTANVLGAGASLLGLTGAYAGVAAIGLRRRDPRRSRR